MKHIRTALPFVLTLLLAACGGNGQTPTPPAPPVEQPVPPVVTPPVTPAPPVTPPTEPPAPPSIPYYGEWAWSFTLNEGCCNEEGRYSIVQVRDVDPAGSGFGFYQTCYQGDCYDSLEGGAIMGPGEDNTLTITLFQVDSAGDFVAIYEATDDDGGLTKDEQGRDVFEGDGQYFDPNYDDGDERGTFKAILTDFPVAFPPAQ